jgi:hypothetical protein
LDSSKCIYELTNASNKLQESEANLQITDISWNSTGLILAASYFIKLAAYY